MYSEFGIGLIFSGLWGALCRHYRHQSIPSPSVVSAADAPPAAGLNEIFLRAAGVRSRSPMQTRPSPGGPIPVDVSMVRTRLGVRRFVRFNHAPARPNSPRCSSRCAILLMECATVLKVVASVLNTFSGVVLLVLDVVFCKCVDPACSGAHGLQSDISPAFLFRAQERGLLSPRFPGSAPLEQVPLLAGPFRASPPGRHIAHHIGVD
jgi:hypothetical protein